MPMNRVQFQPGLSMPEFTKLYGTEAQCEAALVQSRWPTQGFKTAPPAVIWRPFPASQQAAHDLPVQRLPPADLSLIAGTLFKGSNLPLTTWFLAIYLVSQTKTGLSALALKRQLGVSYPTAWLIHHKLMQAQAMAEREVSCGKKCAPGNLSKRSSIFLKAGFSSLT